MTKKTDTWLRRELKQRGWSARYFGRLIEVSYTHAARLVNEEQPLTTEMCRKVAEVLDWTEEDVMRQAGHLSALPNGYSELDEQRLVELYRALSLSERDQLMKFAEFLQKSD